MTEAAAALFLALIAAAVVYAIVARAGRKADRAHDARRAELEALARMHERGVS
jgi:peptidoglycan/LPS O-acetylase OafA/YrhL